MTGKAFHIIISKDKAVLNWSSQQGVPYSMASDMEKDRLIARILHKILNLRLSAEDGGVLGKDEFRVLGITLFKLLFSDEVFKMQFNTFYREALGSPNERYRLVLEFEKDAEEIALLPWEYLFYEADEMQEAFLAAHPKKCIDLMRKLPFKGNWLDFDKGALQIEFPLRVLVIASNPDTGLFMNELAQSLAYFENLKQRFPGEIEVQFIQQPELDTFETELKKAIQIGFPHIIHFIGRGRMENASGQLCFVKKAADGKFAENWVSDDVFAGYFEEWRQLPHLVVLHICDGAPIGNYKEDKGTAIRLAKKGVPFVLTLQNPVPDWMAELLVEKFYDSLLEGMDVAAALTEARFFVARKLKDVNGGQYDNYAHKVFGSSVLFSSVLQPFIVGKIEEPSTPAPNVINIPVQNTPIPVTRNTSQETTATVTQPTTLSAQGEGARSQNRSTANTPTAEKTASTADFSQKERQGLEAYLLETIEKLNFFKVEYVQIVDIGQKFQTQQQIQYLEEEVEKTKTKLGSVRNDRAG